MNVNCCSFAAARARKCNGPGTPLTGLEAVFVTDIPMNRKAAAARALYDVPLLTRRLPGAAPALAELVAAGARAGPGLGSGSGTLTAGLPEGALGGEPLVLRWVKAPKGFQPAALACRRASRALPRATGCAPAPLP